jgi:hypothetical protein
MIMRNFITLRSLLVTNADNVEIDLNYKEAQLALLNTKESMTMFDSMLNERLGVKVLGYYAVQSIDIGVTS